MKTGPAPDAQSTFVVDFRVGAGLDAATDEKIGLVQFEFPDGSRSEVYSMPIDLLRCLGRTIYKNPLDVAPPEA